MAFYLLVIDSKQIVSVGSVRHYPELVTVTRMRLAKFVVLFLLVFVIYRPSVHWASSSVLL